MGHFNKRSLTKYLKTTTCDARTASLIYHVINDIAKKYDVVVHIENDWELQGNEGCAERPNLVFLNGDLIFEMGRCVSTLFHEIGHVNCFRKNLWPAYHSETNLDAAIRTFWKAEKWVDSWAKKEMKKMFPTRRFISDLSTKNKKQIKHLKKQYKNSVLHGTRPLLDESPYEGPAVLVDCKFLTATSAINHVMAQLT